MAEIGTPVFKGSGFAVSWDKKQGIGWIESDDGRTFIKGYASAIHALPGVYKKLEINEQVEFTATEYWDPDANTMLFEATSITGMFDQIFMQPI